MSAGLYPPKAMKPIEVDSNATLIILHEILEEAVSSTSIRIVQLALSSSGAGNITLRSESDEGQSFPWQFSANGNLDLVLPFSLDGWLKSVSGDRTIISNPSGLTLKGTVYYVESKQNG